MAPLRIRPASVADAPAIAALHVEGFEDFRPFVPAALLAARTPERRTLEWQRRLMDVHPRWWTALAEQAESPVGFVCVEHLTAEAFGANSEIHNLFVASEWRRLGVGRSLLAAAAEWIARVGAEPISLFSFADNTHRAAYTHLGGRIAGERRLEWDGVVIPETCYIWPTAADLIAHARHV